MIIIESKRKRPATILKKYPDAILADVTSGAKDGLVKLSPFYPHGGIPVPFSEVLHTNDHHRVETHDNNEKKALKLARYLIYYYICKHKA